MGITVGRRKAHRYVLASINTGHGLEFQPIYS